MSAPSRPTVSAEGTAIIRQRPSCLVMVGSIEASETTLELTLKSLSQKRVAVSRWLESLEATDIKFGEPRFPNQVDPDPVRMVQQRTRQRIRRSSRNEEEEQENKRVVVSYSAVWPIAEKSSDEVLIFVDRLQFESEGLTGSKQEPEEVATPSWSDDPMEEIQSMMAGFPPDSIEKETHFLFLSRVNDAQLEEAMAEAFADAKLKATRIARAAEAELGELQNAHSLRSETESMYSWHQIQRRSTMPLLTEAPFCVRKDEFVTESPRTVEFVLTVHVTYALK